MPRSKRAFIERRTGRDRRRFLSLRRLRYSGPNRRCRERRNPDERRHGWIRISKWSSAPFKDLKIAKFLRGRVRREEDVFPGRNSGER